ncbi:MAG TPA: GNAT family N-acetyltransferase [Candidatus Limnocylindrales bacterium]
MPRVEVRPFEAEHVDQAAALLAERHARHRRAQPLLAPRFEEPSATAEEIAATLAGLGASGAVRLTGGRLTGFLLGAAKPGEAWGPNIWIEAAGHAATDAEAVRDMYGLAATRWVDEGRTAHYVLVPASDPELVSAWFRLCFGHQHSHAIRPIGNTREPADGVKVRPAARDDIPVLARLDATLDEHQHLAPTFSRIGARAVEEYESGWLEDFDDPSYTTFVAEHGGQVIGSAIACSIEKSSAHKGLARPDNAGFLGFAAVLAHARGLGAGRALGQAVIDWSEGAGFDCVVADWRATNLLSSRAWPALGFTESFLRLHRLVGF